MSVGHAARLFEKAGIATVIIAVKAFGEMLASMSLPRVLLTNHPMGRPVGPPMDREYQTEVVSAALDMLEDTSQGGSIRLFDGKYRPHKSM
jgi:hypothetical protein